MSKSPKIVINGAFRGQRVTGQQRYASEIAKSLLAQGPDNVREIYPTELWSKSPWRAWLWALTAGFRTGRDEYLLTLTSRGPMICRNHVVAIHDFFVFTNPEWYSWRYRVTHKAAAFLQWRFARVLVTVSSPNQDLIRTRLSRDAVVAPNAPAAVFLQDTDDMSDARYLEQESLIPDQYILSVGSVDPRKNSTRLIDAFDRLPISVKERFPLVLVGGEEASFSAVAPPTSSYVRTLGYVTDEQLSKLYRSAKVVAFPTKAEGFGLPAAEALAAGSDLLVSDIPVMRWICGEYASFVDPHSVDAINSGLAHSIAKPPLPESAKLERSQYITRKFSWAASAESIANAIEADAQTSRGRSWRIRFRLRPPHAHGSSKARTVRLQTGDVTANEEAREGVPVSATIKKVCR